MREFLSHCGVTYDERNIADDPSARRELEVRLGDVLVPTLVSGGETIVGFDLPAMQRLLGRDEGLLAQGFEGLPRERGDAPAAASSSRGEDDLEARLRVFLDHLEHEMRVNAAKGDYAYRHGVHDGLRFAADGLRTILTSGALPNDGRRALPGRPG